MKRYLLALSLGAAAPAAGQVGYPPESSPFRDLAYRQELTWYVGYFLAGRGVAKVEPQSAPMLGVRYEVRVGGPAQFTARVARVWSERTVLDPNKTGAARTVGDRAWPIYLGDVGLTINLTGQKSFHNFVPLVHAGIGVASDFGRAGDPGGYRFGTPFAFSFGAGTRWLARGPLQFRVDVADYLYQLTYPDTYFDVGTSPILERSRTQNEWKHNFGLTLGVSYLFVR